MKNRGKEEGGVKNRGKEGKRSEEKEQREGGMKKRKNRGKEEMRSEAKEPR